MKRFFWLGASMAVLASLSPSYAQAPAAAPAPTVSDEVVVTGSHITRRDFSAPSAIVTVGVEVLKQSSAVTMENTLMALPQFAAGSSSTNYLGTGGGQANLNLRGLGTNRVLVLLDGQRLQPSGQNGAIDINTIPQTMVEGIETITGGASAAYGSDAIAGVVNFKLKKHFTGAELSGQASTTQYGGPAAKIGITLGHDFADDRGNAVFSYDYTNRDHIQNQKVPFFHWSTLLSTLPNGNILFGANQPSQAALNTVFAKYGAPAGAVGRTQQISVNADGTLFNPVPPSNGPIYNYRGPLATGTPAPLDNILINPANGALSTAISNGSDLQFALVRDDFFSRVTYELTPDIELRGQLMYSNYTADRVQAMTPTGNVSPAETVPVTNPYIPADLATLLASRANPTAPFQLTRIFTQGSFLTDENVSMRDDVDHYNVFQAQLGASGKVGIRDWTWDISGSRGDMTQNSEVRGVYSQTASQLLLNSTQAQINSLCGGGTQSYNPFGYLTGDTSGKISQGCKAFVERVATLNTEITQDTLDASVQGALFTMPAGEVRFAAGADTRRNSYKFRPDSATIANDLIGSNPQGAAAGAQSVVEGYGELLVPLLKDAPLTKNLELNLGYRYSKYAGLDGLSAYKGDVDWTINDVLRLRGGYSRGVRAPSLVDLYSTGSALVGMIGNPTANNVPQFTGDPCDVRSAYRSTAINGSANAAAVRSLCVAMGVPSATVDTFQNAANSVAGNTVGNRTLVPETSGTWSVGGVLRSPFSAPAIQGVTLSLDYYKINIDDAIGVLGLTTALAKCGNADGSNPTYSAASQYCTLFTRGSDGTLTSAIQPTLNMATYQTSGVDMQVDWNLGLRDIGLPDWGDLRANLIVTRLLEFNVAPFVGAPVLDYAGSTGNGTSNLSQDGGALPKWKANLRTTYINGPFSVTWTWRHYDSMKPVAKVTSPTAIADDVPAYNAHDFSANWAIRENMVVRAGVTNAFGEPIPNTAGLVTTLGTTDRSLYSVLGRQYSLALDYRF